MVAWRMGPMESIRSIAVAGYLLLVGLGCIYLAYTNARCAWFIMRTPISAIGNLTTGNVPVQGQGVAQGKSAEPAITGRTSLYFLFAITEVVPPRFAARVVSAWH